MYPPIEEEFVGGVDNCELLANEERSICPGGIQDCIDSPDGHRCRNDSNAISPVNKGKQTNAMGHFSHQFCPFYVLLFCSSSTIIDICIL